MKTHYMKLHPGPFRKTVEGAKHIEMRLNDQKRKEIAVGDRIVFTSREDSVEEVSVRVTELVPFSTFQEIFEAFSPAEYGGKSKDEYAAMYQYYTKEDEARYGVVAIRFELV